MSKELMEIIWWMIYYRTMMDLEYLEKKENFYTELFFGTPRFIETSKYKLWRKSLRFYPKELFYVDNTKPTEKVLWWNEREIFKPIIIPYENIIQRPKERKDNGRFRFRP